jgi:thiol:disulfide interchange protein DsbD
MALLAALVVAVAAAPAFAKPWWMRGVESNDTDFLPPDTAFRVGSSVEGNAIKVRWVIAPGYYLYRQKIAVGPESPDLVVTGIDLPRGVSKTDPYLGTQEILTGQVEGSVSFQRFDYGAHPLQIKVTYQGCAEAGLCYPPIVKVLAPLAAGADEGGAGLPGSGSASGGINPAEVRADSRWEGVAIVGGVAAFLLAGLSLRKGRQLDPPPP